MICLFNNLTQHELDLYMRFETTSEGASRGLQHVFHHYNKLLHDHGFISEAPLQVTISLTDECNIRCLHCSRNTASSMRSTSKYMRNWKLVLDNLAECEVSQISFSGGEPTLHPEIDDILTYAKDKGFFVGLLTNAAGFNDNLMALIKAKFDHEYDYVRISLDDLYEHYSELRVGSTFEMVDDVIKKLVANGVNVQVATVISTANLNRLYDIYKYCVTAKVNAVRFIPLFSHPNTLLKPPRDEEVIKKFCEILAHRQLNSDTLKTVSSPIPLVYPFSVWLKRNRPDIQNLFPTDRFICPATITSCEISPDGYVYPCSYFDCEEFVAGNVFHEDFKSIWRNGLNWGKLRKGLIVNANCSGCEEFHNCLSGCPAKNYYNVNSCEMVKL